MTKKQRPDIVQGWTRRINTGCGRLYVTVNELDGKPFEVFCKLGKAGGCAASQVEAIGRLIAMSLRSGVEIQEITKQLIGISCHMPVFNSRGRVLSCSDGLAQVLAERYNGVGEHADPPSMVQEQEQRERAKAEDLGLPSASDLADYEIKKAKEQLKAKKLDQAQKDEAEKKKLDEAKAKYDEMLRKRVKEQQQKSQGACPECGGPIQFQEGCKKCVCGYTEC